ncbi:MAG: tRNA lysidine(34) synthetase TilS [Clostridia bacterium]|nr:tRNA lysidine(34) synthetase TilS [Clostridia bacterium]
MEKYRGKRVCCAVSGGIDSVCLLHAFRKGAKQYNITLSAVTCEHGIRGEASLSDVEFVKQVCAAWDIPLFIFSADIPKRAQQSGRGLEEEGRTFRYGCFAQILQTEADLIATAHHLDDVAETVLFRLARGTSLKGLAAIRERDGIVRPMLSVPKTQVEEYANRYGLPFVTDETNEDESYSRNAIRKTVLPELENVVNGAKEHLVEFAQRAVEDDEYLQVLAGNTLTREGDGIRIYAMLPPPIFSRACILALNELGVKQNYTEANVREITTLKRLQSGKKVCLPSGIEAVREGDDIYFYKPKPRLAESIPFSQGVFAVGEYTVTVREGGGEGLYADLDAFPKGCVIRTRRVGDRITPFKGSEKGLKEFLTDKKVPARVSWNLPLIAKGSEVFAVFGVDISDRVKVTKETKRCVRLSMK